jgi:hypothetical protein
MEIAEGIELKDESEEIRIYRSPDDWDFIRSNLGKLVRVSETEYIKMTDLHEQDLVDLKEIKEISHLADLNPQ